MDKASATLMALHPPSLDIQLQGGTGIVSVPTAFIVNSCGSGINLNDGFNAVAVCSYMTGNPAPPPFGHFWLGGSFFNDRAVYFFRQL